MQKAGFLTTWLIGSFHVKTSEFWPKKCYIFRPCYNVTMSQMFLGFNIVKNDHKIAVPHIGKQFSFIIFFLFNFQKYSLLLKTPTVYDKLSSNFTEQIIFNCAV